MSDVTGATRWLGPSADTAAKRNVWLGSLIAIVTVLALYNLANDTALGTGYGWDARVNCAAVDAHVAGLDPYFVKNLKGTSYSYPYLPATLDAFRPFCAGGLLVDHYRGFYLVLAALCGLLLPGLRRSRAGLRDVGLKVLCALGAFVGFEWVLASGNFAILGGLLTAVALALLLPAEANGDRRFLMRAAGAALLGLVVSFKLVFCPVLAALYFLPLRRARKLGLLAVAGFGFALPILISVVFYPELFASWLLAIKGQIPNQHSVHLEEINPSLLLVARNLMDHIGLADSRPIEFAIYALAAFALVITPFALVLLSALGIAAGGASFPARLDRWLMDHPQTAMRVTVLAMYGLYLCSPRIKEYAFFELALYLAVLVVDLSTPALAMVLTVAIASPAMASIAGVAFEGSFALLAIALVCFWTMLFDFRSMLARDQREELVP
ncbi:hypothetical protein L6654_29970 [Bradyrhizobium sp. WYCCWR 13023]|uniref:Uncharacterized protein n=1 Tax=Bradyrhizobium zhengyangense TaxID=2911009 RepID=A0A9X1RGT9_9BRAD|nr:hypothetical protein [Bradyrhizobium sp. CCBAU 11434]MCG2630863.1 hypothetical protein [Bradyrhizobium zhengyangense]MCG2644482.1 hypothetical protein [Bradyrhizobium zhengyangense]MCG2672082.1 hypothetical protein [Bradyrhizobium zhengyangense]MDA9519652.1 hypothetical protein [Bradyrhizobium sp. CCBAU 11434]